MRRSPSRWRRPILGAVGFALALVATTIVRGQETASDATSLARYVPKDDLILYIEFDGLDAHADAWKKTAAYKILNNTPVGEMLEAVVIQMLQRLPAVDPTGKPLPLRGPDLYTLFKHMARSGFLIAEIANRENPKKSPLIFVIRNGFKDKAVRPILATVLQGYNAPNTKPQAVVRAGHKVISGVNAAGTGWAWWIEESKKEDLVQVFPGPEAADVFLEALDGKRPNAINHPRRTELFKPENGFQPNGAAFFDSIMFDEFDTMAKLGLTKFSKLDYRWGFQDDALLSVLRLVTPSPRKGIPALLEGAYLDKGKLPPIPDNVTGFTVASFDMPTTLDRLTSMVRGIQPNGDDVFKTLADTLKEKTKLRLKEDILAHLGPKVAWYTLPSKKAAPAGPAGFIGMLNPAMDIPKLAIVFDIDDPSAFGKSLDQAMAAVNRELKSVGKPPADPAAAKGGRGRAPSGPSIEFRLIPGETKTYVLNIPQELAGQIPPTVRPTVRVGSKHVVLAVSPDVARTVLDAKGTWTPPSNLTSAFQGLSSSLKILNVSDPRDGLPELLATLPAKIQQIAALAAIARPRPVPPGANPANPPAGPAPLILNIDAAKVPSADAIRSLLFPSLFTIESTGDEIRIVSRDAFPSIGDPSTMSVQMALILPAIQAARDAARRAAGQGGVPPASKPPGGRGARRLLRRPPGQQAPRRGDPTQGGAARPEGSQRRE